MESEINYLFELLINPIIRDHILNYLKFCEIYRLRRLSHSMKSFVDEIYLPELKELKINILKHYSEVSRSTIPLCVSKHTGALRVLNVSYISLNVDFIQLIRSNPNIIELHWTNNYIISSLFWDDPDEQHLEFEKCIHLLSAPSIQEISVKGCLWVEDYVLEALSHSTTLQYLSLQLCSNITDAGLGFLANGCPSLKTIFLESNPFITDDGINLKILEDKGVITWTDYEVVDDNSMRFSRSSPDFGF